jgi:metallo-beta-lactamase superfamily protein
MLYASELEPVAPGICLWRFYDPSVKADLFSTALQTPSGTYLVDPIPLQLEALASLTALGEIAGIIVTNENHERGAARFVEELGVPIYLDAGLASTTKLPGVVPIGQNTLPGEVKPVAIEGAPAGEIAIHFAASGGTMVIGDALINFDPYGFALLPAKYCSNFKLMRRSLPRLLDYSFERILFAHGMPILSRARERLELLLEEHP